MDPDRAAVVAGACCVLHNMAMLWKVPYDVDPEQPEEEEEPEWNEEAERESYSTRVHSKYLFCMNWYVMSLWVLLNNSGSI